ncbi:MAG TPA: hypothetical protein DDW52_06645 [Planctomycetaceae bacterium]|nr:hypothetical protein [Planctomycetaceae bacterium]
MQVKFDVAIFGEKGTEHGLIESTKPSVPPGLIARTDLPVGLEGLMPRSQLYSGFPLGNDYVFLATLPDPSAQREGMARTIAFWTGVELVTALTDLSPVIQRLDDVQEGKQPAEAFSVSTKEGVALSDQPDSRSLAVFDSLVTNGTGQPIVWSGLDAFGRVLIDLWRMLPAKTRPSFSFRTMCRPPVEGDRVAQLICVPSERIARWNSFTVLGPTAEPSPDKRHTHELGDPQTRKDIYQFASDLGVTLDSLDQLPTLTRCYSGYVDLEKRIDLDVTKMFRWVAKLSPGTTHGAAIKKRILSTLCSRARGGSLETFVYLRNLSVQAYPGGMEQLSNACEEGFGEILRDSQPALIPLVHDAFDSSDLAWSKGVLRATTNAIGECIPEAVCILAELFDSMDKPKVVRWIEDACSSAAVEDCLIQHASATIKSNASTELLALCQRNRWARLHLHAGKELLSTKELLRRQATFDSELALVIDEMVGLTGDAKFVEAAMQLEIEDYWNQVAVCCRGDESLLMLFDAKTPAWRFVFCRLVDEGLKFSESIEHFLPKISEAWQAIALGEIQDPEFACALSESCFSSVLAVENRKDLWPRLEPDVRKRVLSSTAKAWFCQPEPIAKKTQSIERPLREEILDERNRHLLLPADELGDLQTSIQALEQFDELTERDFGEFRNRFLSANRKLPEPTAHYLGKYIQQRNWPLLADAVLRDFKRLNRKDLLPAMIACRAQYSWLTRYRYGLILGQMPEEEWWNEAVNVLCEAYPSGPMDRALWVRANGSPWEITTHKSGKENWTHAIGILRGSRDPKTLQIGGLLWQAAEDADGDSEIAALIQHCPFNLDVSRHEPFVD